MGCRDFQGPSFNRFNAQRPRVEDTTPLVPSRGAKSAGGFSSCAGLAWSEYKTTSLMIRPSQRCLPPAIRPGPRRLPPESTHLSPLRSFPPFLLAGDFLPAPQQTKHSSPTFFEPGRLPPLPRLRHRMSCSAPSPKVTRQNFPRPRPDPRHKVRKQSHTIKFPDSFRDGSRQVPGAPARGCESQNVRFQNTPREHGGTSTGHEIQNHRKTQRDKVAPLSFYNVLKSNKCVVP